VKTYKNYYIITDIPEIVYRALVNPLILRLWTGFDVEMSETVDSEFSLWEGNILGKNLAFEKDKMIQQQWYFGDQEEPSIVTIKLHSHKKGTSAELIHTNIPDDDYDAIVEGWNNTYFADLIDFYMGE
jgi:activator of HSP90 ATPase